jgi:hypothetical protein
MFVHRQKRYLVGIVQHFPAKCRVERNAVELAESVDFSPNALERKRPSTVSSPRQGVLTADAGRLLGILGVLGRQKRVVSSPGPYLFRI